MRVKLIKDFINNNSKEQQKEYNNLLLEKLKDMSRLNDKISLYMIILVIVYFFFRDSTIKDINISFMKIEKFEIIAQFTPPIFSLIFLYYMTLNAHRAEIIQFSRILVYEIYNNTLEDKASIIYNESNAFARIIQPFSIWLETSKWDINGKASPLDALLRLPVLILILLPFVFLIFALKNLYIEYWHSPFSIYSFIFSIWLTLYTVYCFLRVVRKNYYWALEA